MVKFLAIRTRGDDRRLGDRSVKQPTSVAVDGRKDVRLFVCVPLLLEGFLTTAIRQVAGNAATSGEPQLAIGFRGCEMLVPETGGILMNDE